MSPNGTRAYVTLQEVNAVAVIDLTNPAADQPLSILPLGMIDRSLVGNEFDGSDQDGAGTAGSIQIENHPVFSLLQPDAIASFTFRRRHLFRHRERGRCPRRASDPEEVRLSNASYDLDDTVFPNEADLKNNDDIGRLNVINHEGDTDGDGDIDQIVTYGGRGISIFRQNDDGTHHQGARDRRRVREDPRQPAERGNELQQREHGRQLRHPLRQQGSGTRRRRPCRRSTASSMRS